MTNWKTTLCGLAAAILIAIQSEDWTNWKTLALCVATAAWGFFSKDFNVTGTKSA